MDTKAPSISFTCGLDLGERMTGLATADLRSLSGKEREFIIPTVHLTDVWEREAKADKHLKVPSVLLLDPKLQCIAFGDDALWQWSQLSESHRLYYHLVESYKSVLDRLGGPVTAADLKVQTASGAEIAARPVFVQLIAYMKRIIRRYIFCRFGCTPAEDEVSWVVTVPVVWSPAGKAFLRDVLTEAKLSPTPALCTIVDESTAALICCRKQRGAYAVLGPMKESDYYMVADLGGFSDDFSLHKCIPEAALPSAAEAHEFRHDEVCASRGGRWGSDHFNRSFIKLMGQWFGADKLLRYKTTQIEEWFFICDSIERLKRECHPENKRDYSILLPISFVCAMGGVDTVAAAIEAANKEMLVSERKQEEDKTEGWTEIEVASEEKTLRFSRERYRLFMAPAFVHGLLKQLISSITETIKSMIDSLPPGKSVTLYSVGGFSESLIVQDALKQTVAKLCADRKVTHFKPTNPTMAVVEGALIIGSRRGRSVYSYIEPYGWGLETLVTPTAKHLAEKRPLQRVYPIWNNKEAIEQTSVFRQLLAAGSVLLTGQTVRATVYPATTLLTTVSLPICCTAGVSVEYPDDPRCQIIGHLVIDIPQDLPASEITHAIDLEYRFGTEISVTAALRGRPVPCKLVFK